MESTIKADDLAAPEDSRLMEPAQGAGTPPVTPNEHAADAENELAREVVPLELEREMERAIARYPADRKRSASMPLLHLWQEHFGFISDHGICRSSADIVTSSRMLIG